MSEYNQRIHRKLKRANTLPLGNVGSRSVGDAAGVHGGGGPENFGAKSSTQAAIPFTDNQPSWSWEDHQRSEYFGPAAPTTTPNLAGIPSNNFRALGDFYGGRQ